jgi:acetyltransferase
MSIHNLNRLFQPRSVAVIGASRNKSSIGNILLTNLIQGFGRPFYAVNPKYDSIDGVTCCESILAIKETVDLAIVCTPANTVPDIVNECGQAGVANVLVISAGFREVGAHGRELEEAIQKIALQYSGLRIIGPNCLGILSPQFGLNASFANQLPAPGRIAFISQSGAVCTAAMDWAMDQGIGFSAVASLGNTLDVDLGDMIDYLATDPNTDSIVLYIESIGNARKFMSAARAFTRKKPIVALKSGRFAQSAQAAASHTGALVGEDCVYDAALARAGIVRVHELMELFSCAEMLSRGKLPTGPRLAIVTNAGGPGIMTTDAVLARQGTMAKLSVATLAALDHQLPSTWSHQNPIDILGDAAPQRYENAIRTVLDDQAVDGVVVLLTPQAMTEPDQSAIALVEASRNAAKPVLAVWMGGPSVAAGIGRLNQASIPTFESPEQAVDAFASMVQYVRRRQLLDETPHDRAIEFRFSQAERDATVAGKSGLLNELESKSVLAAYEIPTNETCLATDVEQAIEIARRMNGAVALKIASPDITHKTNVGGVVLNLRGDEEVARAYEKIISAAGRAQPNAQLLGVTVQPMVVDPNAVELIVGVKRDPTFGAVMMVGSGGTMAELIRDRVVELPPLNDVLARRMLESMRAWPLLNGFRGRPQMDVQQLVGLMIRLSYMVAERPEIVELDINPLMVTPHSTIAVDARMVLIAGEPKPAVKRFAHLAIRPYPIGLSKDVTLLNGKVVRLRPIRPDDEGQWIKMLESCSTATIHNRFGGLVHHFNHEFAARFCNIDYDRELALVAELDTKDKKSLVGVARLVAYSDGVRASLSFLVGDAWQNQGLATELTDYCMEIASDWKIAEVIATTTAENLAARRLLKGVGFEETLSEGGIVVARKVLS